MSDDVIKEAKRRFDRCQNWESSARERYLADYMFANGDSSNGYQWSQSERDNRFIGERPCLTVNKVRQHNLNIINEAKQNKPAIKYMPTGNGATFEAAQIWTALARSIEYHSNASDAYGTATNFMVQGGWGYVRLVTEYEDERSFRQQLRILRVPDPFNVFLDPDARELDKSDSKFAFIFEDHDREEFVQKFPQYEKLAAPLTFAPDGWVTDTTVRTAEYFRIVEHEDVLWEFLTPGQPSVIAYESELPKEALARWKDDRARARSRDVTRKVVEWKYIVGDEVVEENIWPGKYIPIVPFIAEETVILGEMDRKSHTRALKDPQRIYNYYTSSAVEFGALQTKTPWLAAADAIDGLETQWNTANRVNRSVLTYRPYDDQGQPLPPPQRIEPPVSAPLSIQGMEIAGREMAMVSGQYEAQMGAPSNERSGKAINERQRMGDRATYHYIDACAVAIRQVGKIILDTVPRIYEPEQVLQILAEDGVSMEVKIDPTLAQAFVAKKNEDQEIVQRIFNPAIGSYDVHADVGPGYATRREETFNALVLLLTQAPQLAGVIGDLLFRSGDFMYADEAAERLRRMVPPQALGQGPTQQEQLLMQQVAQLKELLAKNMQDLAAARIKLQGRDEKRDIEVYRAFTERLKVLEASKTDDLSHKLAVAQLINDIMNDSLQATQENVDENLGAKPEQAELPLEVPPMQGAQKAPDGHWYVKDPMRPGRYMKVMPNA
jgi:hypothetical protein